MVEAAVLAWILGAGLAMSVLALTGGLTVLLPDHVRHRVVPPLVALAAGSLLGGALFQLLPTAVDRLGNGIGVWLWTCGGFLLLLFLEQLLHWHHRHDPDARTEPMGWMLLVADGVHNFVGGAALAGAFLVDVRLGIVTWFVLAVHEVPQELADFGVLLHSGWRRRRALAFNFLSALTFPLGSLVAVAAASVVAVDFLLPLAAGNFLYVAASDLVPDLKHRHGLRARIGHLAVLLAGLALVLAAHLLAPGHA